MTGAQSGGYTFPASGDYDGRYLQPSEYDCQPAYTRQSDNPPSYSPRSQYVQPRSYTQQQMQQPPGSLWDMATVMAMELMSNGKSKSGKKDKRSKGSELLSEFFK